MRSDFEPVHLKQANVKLDKLLTTSEEYQKHDDVPNKISLWKKFLKLFTINPFVLPENFYK